MENEDTTKEKDTTSASEETSTEETSQEDSPQDIDYKAELERVTKERHETARELEQAQHTIIELKRKPKPEDTEETAAAAPDVREVVRQEMLQQRAEDRIDQRASSPAEAQLTKFHYQHSIVKTGNISEDVENAFALANRKKVSQQMDELKRAAGKPKASSTVTSAGQRTEVKTEVELTPQEQIIAQRYGLKPEEIAKAKQG